jgi:hypothetical protein
MLPRFVALAVAALYVFAARPAAADPQTPAPTPTPVVLPTLAPSQPLNPYVKMGIDLVNGLMRQQLAISANMATGRVSYFRRFEMQVQTAPNSYRDVHLHQGTIINPRGASITAGQRVSVNGLAQPDGSLDANVITIQQ